MFAWGHAETAGEAGKAEKARQAGDTTRVTAASTARPPSGPATVEQAVLDDLLAEGAGLLSRVRIPVGGPLHRSVLVAAVQGVRGVASVTSLMGNSKDFPVALTARPGE
jgi:hypothetical protein